MNCAICGIRKPKRQCPGVDGQICSICCGTEREQSIDCPLECAYLREAHRYEKLAPLDPASIPNQDIRVPDEFVRQHEWVLVLLGSAIANGALRSRGTTDFDIREALAALVETWRTAQSGLIYEPKTVNPFAAAIRDAVQRRIDDIRQHIAAAEDPASPSTGAALSDPTVLVMLAFLQRLEYAHNNGRKRSRAFLGFLQQFHVPDLPLADEAAGQTPESESMDPRAPLVIL